MSRRPTFGYSLGKVLVSIYKGVNYAVGSSKDDSALSVEIVGLDNYGQEHDIERIDLMKMELEGGEHDALLGAQRLLEKQAIGCTSLKMSERASKRSGCCTAAINGLLEDAGYHLFRHGSPEPMPIEAESVTPGENAIAFVREPEWPRL